MPARRRRRRLTSTASQRRTSSTRSSPRCVPCLLFSLYDSCGRYYIAQGNKRDRASRDRQADRGSTAGDHGPLQLASGRCRQETVGPCRSRRAQAAPQLEEDRVGISADDDLCIERNRRTLFPFATCNPGPTGNELTKCTLKISSSCAQDQ